MRNQVVLVPRVNNVFVWAVDMILSANPLPMINVVKTIAIGVAIVIGVLSLPASEVLGQVHNNKPLELSGLSISQAYEIEDDQPLDLEDPMILQLVYQIKKTSPKSRRAYGKYSKDLTWDQLKSKIEDYRLWVVDRKVRLKKITKHRFASAEQGDPVKGVFVCHCENEHQQPLVVLSRSAPRSLPLDTQLDEPISLDGFLFSRRHLSTHNDANQSAGDAGTADDVLEDADHSDASSTLVFIVDRIGWYPDQIVPSRSNESFVALGQAGVDIGLLDFVRENNARKLGHADSEAFYQMIGGVNRLGQDAEFENPIGFVDIMKDSKSNFGNATRIKGVVRTCAEISIPDPEVASRIGVLKYYQLIIFPNLDGNKVVVKDRNGKDIEYSRFPITICCHQLPAGLTPTSIERKQILIDGFFFRFWKYQSDKTDASGASGQVSPLIIAHTPIPIESHAEWLDFMLLCFVSVLIIGFSILAWWYRGIDRRRKSPGQKIMESLPDELDVTGIEQ